ncbi:MAG: PilZ domain-containing protein [Hyphomicrobiales bacterium]|jgi:hypothetical protein
MLSSALEVASSHAADRRRFQRVEVNLLGRFMLPNWQEYPCQVIDMSPGGAGIISPVTGNIGDRIVAYIDHIGRVEGTISRHISGGFAMSINASQRKRDKLASQLTYLANKDILDLPEDRRHDRQPVENPYTRLTMPDGREYQCAVMDISLSGAAVRTTVRPAVNSMIHLGNMRARVVRHLEDGIALEFASVQKDGDTSGAFIS